MRSRRRVLVACSLLAGGLLLPGEPALASGRLAPSSQVDVDTPSELKVARRRGKRRGASKKGRVSSSRSVERRARGQARKASGRTVTPPAAETPRDADHAPLVGTRQGPARVDFDERLVQGQSNRSGAIYLFERQGAELRTMVRRRQSFREEILRTVE